MFYRFVAAGDVRGIRPTRLTGKMGTLRGGFRAQAVGILLSSFVWNTFAMKKTIRGLPPVGFPRLLRGEASARTLTGVVGGVIWGVGMFLQT